MQRPWALHFAAMSAWLAFLGGRRSRGHYHDDIIYPIILSGDEGNTPREFLHHISSSIIFPTRTQSSISIGESQAKILAAANSSSPRESDRHRRSSWTFQSVGAVLVAATYKTAMDHALACASSPLSCHEVLVVEDPLLSSLSSIRAGLTMYLIEDKGGAIALMLASLLFLGTWPAVLTLLERRGRLPQHTYLDYSITNLLAAVVIALTFGQLGNSKDGMPNFITQLSQNNWPSVLFAMAGGVVLSVGNLSTQYAWAYVGLSVTEVISSSMVVVIGTTLNYFLDNRINRAEILFPGVACFLVAVILGSAVHASNAADNEEKLNASNKLGANGSVDPSKGVLDKDAPKDLENGASGTKQVAKAEAGTAEYLIELEERRSIKVFGSSTIIGLSIVFFSGVCFSLFSPAINLATNDQWHTLKDGVPHLVVYTAFFYFSISCFVVGIGLNILFLYRPMAGVPKSSFKAYLNDWNGRQWALLAGLLCGFGNGFQFMGGQAAGYAAADAVQALPLVSTFWGILLFGEYRKSSRKTYILLGFMLFMFIAAVAILMASSGHRSTK